MNYILKPVNTTVQKVPFGLLKLAWCVDLQSMQDRDQSRVIWGVSEFVMDLAGYNFMQLEGRIKVLQRLVKK